MKKSLGPMQRAFYGMICAAILSGMVACAEGPSSDDNSASTAQTTSTPASTLTTNSSEDSETSRLGAADAIQQSDANGDGQISQAEWTQTRSSRFSAWDSNRDGALTQAEIQAGMEAEHAAQQVDKLGTPIAKADWVARAAAVFTQLDANSDGSLSSTELPGPRGKAEGRGSKGQGRPEMGVTLGTTTNAPVKVPAAQGTTANLDTDGNGVISQAEWVAEAEARFTALDANADGSIALEEMKPVRDHQNKPASVEGSTKTNPADSNGDGQISQAEWETQGASLFTKLDVNADGSLSQEELTRKK